jgi:hypothetical protein
VGRGSRRIEWPSRLRLQADVKTTAASTDFRPTRAGSTPRKKTTSGCVANQAMHFHSHIYVSIPALCRIHTYMGGGLFAH